MYRRLNLSKTFCLTLLLTLLLTPAVAHKVEVVGDVAGTWHVEPNHNPKAGESSLAWVALTRKGGKILPLSDTNCQMLVYSQPRQATDSPVVKPTLKAINVENYQGIPGADIVFPKIGIYQLELSCQPKKTGDFQAFQMKYDVTVAASSDEKINQIEASSSSSTKTQAQNNQEFNFLIFPLVGLLGLGFIIAIMRLNSN